MSEWIPVSERLPEEIEKEYLVQRANGIIRIAEFVIDENGNWYDYYEGIGTGHYISDVIAWMPLPELYKGK